jgi:alginate O-acetyltransferase complex protein AlgI
MLFNSFDFLIFFPLVCLMYFAAPHRFRWFILLAASCYFYMYFVPIYIVILAFTIVIDYVAGLLIERSEGKKRKMYLILSLISNILVLAIFKYYNFFIDNIGYVCDIAGLENRLPYLSILLPVGLSFHTFQAMSYTIEVYRGNQKAEKHFGIYSLYVMFFPQLVAGPIERPQNVLHQFHEKHKFTYHNFVEGAKLMLWGFFIKVVVADRLAIYVDAVYNNYEENSGTSLIIATIFFTFQIYCDFAGYSYIAIGSAKIMGYDLMTNFRRPYFAKTISEFWKRWHISLSTWFRDYLYIPLGGNKVSKYRWYFNLFFIFLVSGIWHGANWTFVIWGALNGLYLVFAIISQDFRDKVNNALGLTKNKKIFSIIQITTTFLLCAFAWIFFRAPNVGAAFTIVEKIFTNVSTDVLIKWDVFFACSIGLFILFIKEFFEEYNIKVNVPVVGHPFTRLAVYSFLISLIILLGVFGAGQFIYFQF